MRNQSIKCDGCGKTATSGEEAAGWLSVWSEPLEWSDGDNYATGEMPKADISMDMCPDCKRRLLKYVSGGMGHLKVVS